MSLSGKQKVLAALAGFGALVAANYYFKPPVPRAIALRMNRELDQYNATPHPEQDRTYDFRIPFPTPHPTKDDKSKS